MGNQVLLVLPVLPAQLASKDPLVFLDHKALKATKATSRTKAKAKASLKTETDKRKAMAKAADKDKIHVQTATALETKAAKTELESHPTGHTERTRAKTAILSTLGLKSRSSTTWRTTTANT